ncbi:MAG: DNA gyrase inhibitor YacG [Bdellovibrionaceae bacterium]|nr:DNA gyrase inhibitor YacG [Pseudobdellovibrionaceae bacterium]
MKALIVSCPRCGNKIEYSLENKHRPFCSERCQLIDLGEWASESYKIPVKNTEFDTSARDKIGDDIPENEDP